MRILIIGGGYSGACFAIQALARTGYTLTPAGSGTAAYRLAPQSINLQITIIEPRDALGRGLAYSSEDSDHRINAPSFGHMALAGDIAHFHEWFVQSGGLQRDPGAEAGGLLFPRRLEFGNYLESLLAGPLANGTIRHLRDRAEAIVDDAGALTVRTTGGSVIPADRIVIATGHLPAAIPGFVSPTAAANPRFISSPWNAEALSRVATNARVLILGSGLTAADVIASLRRNGHQGSMRVVSRRGLRPQALPPPSDTPPLPIWQRLQQPIPEFLRPAADAASGNSRFTVRGLLRALRIRIAERADAGISWHEAFDDLRDALYRIWPKLSAAEQRRFHRHLRPWYDSYRYRMPPQTGATLAAAEASGQLVFEAAQVVSISADAQTADIQAQISSRGGGPIRDDRFDAVVNCTGPGRSIAGVDPFIDSLLNSGLVRPHASGVGLDVDSNLIPYGLNGQRQTGIRVIGPQTAGAFGDPIGAVFICAQIDRMIDHFLTAEAAVPSD